MKLQNKISKVAAIKSFSVIIAVSAIALVSFSFGVKFARKEAIIGSPKVTQVAVVVKDIEKARKAWAAVLGMAEPAVSIAEGHESRPTLIKTSQPAPNASLLF